MIDLMEGELDMWFEWPPSLNNYYSHTQYGVHISKKGKQYREAVCRDVRIQVGSKVLPEKSLDVIVVLFAPDKRKRDLDNHCKALLDALMSAEILPDDSWIDRLEIIRGVVSPKASGVFVRFNPGWGYEREGDRGLKRELLEEM